MKKFFTLIAMAVMAMNANAQQIAFTEEDVAPKGSLDGKVFEAGSFKLTITDTDGKFELDKNAQFFGDAENQVKSAGGRLKSGGKSSSKNFMAVSIPAAGTLKVWVRTGSNSATDRTLVITQGENELYNKVVQESDAVKVVGLDEADPTKETNVYPVIAVDVIAGDAVITYPVGSMNFYGFEFVEDGATAIENVKVQTVDGVMYNLAGQKVGNDFKGIVIKDGKKMLQK